MRPLNVGIIGCGTIAKRHADRLAERGENVAGAADIDPDAREAFAAAYDDPSTYENYETMIAELSLDLVVVAVPNFLHADCAIAALEDDTDVFVEKPLANSYSEALRVADAAADSDGRVVVGFVRAFSEWFRDLRDRASDGEFGRIYDVDVEYVRRRGIPQLGSWFTRKDRSGGGVLIDAGVHYIHLALALLGFPKIETVSASTGANFGTKDDYTYVSMWGGHPIDGGTFDTEDYARGFVRTADGSTIHVHSAWASNTDPRQQLRVQGDEAGATVEHDGGGFVPTMYGDDRNALTKTELTVTESEAFEAQWKYVADVARGEREHTQNTLEEGLAVQRVVESMYESAADGREVTLVDG